MTAKYTLPEHLIKKAADLEEFALGGLQVTAKLKDGSIHRQLLISNSTWIIAMRSHKDLPFAVSEIEDIFQTDEDKNPKQRGGWEFWH
jgi:hypothetical protein